MNEPIEDSLTEKANAAFRQAAAKVIERARQTGTPVLVWEDGRVIERKDQDAGKETQGHQRQARNDGDRIGTNSGSCRSDQVRRHFPIRERVPGAGIRKFLIFLMKMKSCGILKDRKFSSNNRLPSSMMLAGRAGARKHEMSPSERGTDRNRDRVKKRRTLWCRPPGTRRSTADGSSVCYELNSRKRTHHNKDWLVARKFPRRASKTMERSQESTGPTFDSRQNARNEAIIWRMGTTAWMTSSRPCASTGIETANEPNTWKIGSAAGLRLSSGPKPRPNEPKREVGQRFARHFTRTVVRKLRERTQDNEDWAGCRGGFPWKSNDRNEAIVESKPLRPMGEDRKCHRGSYLSGLQSKR